jgi:hypothetical protein
VSADRPGPIRAAFQRTRERLGRSTIESLGVAALAAIVTLAVGHSAGVTFFVALLVAIVVSMLAFCVSLSVVVRGVESRLAKCEGDQRFVTDRLTLQRGMRNIEAELRQERATSTSDEALDAAFARFAERAITLLQTYPDTERRVSDVEAIIAKSDSAGERLDELADLIARGVHDGDYGIR